jgi:hypothetical protein
MPGREARIPANGHCIDQEAPRDLGRCNGQRGGTGPGILGHRFFVAQGSSGHRELGHHGGVTAGLLAAFRGPREALADPVEAHQDRGFQEGIRSDAGRLLRQQHFAAVAVLFGIGLGLAPIATEGLASLGYAITVAAIAGMALIGIYVRYQNRSRGFIAKLVQPLPEHLGEWLMRNVDAFGEGLGATANTWQLVIMSLQSLLIWLLVTAAIHLSLLAVGMRLPFDASLLLLGATVFAVTLPAAPGFFGTFQLAYVLALKPYGIDNESAVAASIVFHLPVYFSVTFVGMLIVGRLGMSWHAVKHEAEEIEESGVTKIIGNAEGRPVK